MKRKQLIISHSTMFPGSVYLAYKEDIDPFRYIDLVEAEELKNQLIKAIENAIDKDKRCIAYTRSNP